MTDPALKYDAYVALAEETYERFEAAEEAGDDLKANALRSIWLYLIEQAARTNAIIH